MCEGLMSNRLQTQRIPLCIWNLASAPFGWETRLIKFRRPVCPPAWIKRLQISFTLTVTSGLILPFSPFIDVNLKDPADSCKSAAFLLFSVFILSSGAVNDRANRDINWEKKVRLMWRSRLCCDGCLSPADLHALNNLLSQTWGDFPASSSV